MTDAVNAPAAAPAAPGAPADAPAVASAPAAPASPIGALAAAPAAPAAPANPGAIEAEVSDKGAYTYQPSGDKGLDMALGLFGKAGIGPEDPAFQAAFKDGDFSLLRATLSTANVPGWEAHVVLAEKAYERINGDTKAKQAADLAAVHQVAGGEENWKAVTEWAATNADEGEKEVLRDMLSKGGNHAKLAASFLVGAYQRQADTEGPGKSATNANGAAANASDALDARAYAQEVAKARAAHNPRMGSFEQSKAYLDLQARRARYRG